MKTGSWVILLATLKRAFAEIAIGLNVTQKQYCQANCMSYNSLLASQSVILCHNKAFMNFICSARDGHLCAYKVAGATLITEATAIITGVMIVIHL